MIEADETVLRRSASFDTLAGIESPLNVDADLPAVDGDVVFAADAEEPCPCGDASPVCGPACRRHGRCDPPGLIQRLGAHHQENGACWVARADGLILWRNAPAFRPLVVTSAAPNTSVLGADQLESTATGGVRGSLMRVDGCCGNAWEIAYLYAGNFTAQRALPSDPAAGPAFALAEPGIYGNNSLLSFSSGTAGLLARLQSAEFNRHVAVGPNWRWLAGFRWLQWQEKFTLADQLNDGTLLIDDFYQTDCVNDLYGGQIGADARLFTLAWLRVDSTVKAGAYYNAALQDSTYITTNSTDPAQSGGASVHVAQSPAACSFVGEVGLNGVMPITPNLDFRFGYLGLFLTGLVQPTQQLSGQSLPVGGPAVGTLTATGGTVVQGISLGLEGRW